MLMIYVRCLLIIKIIINNKNNNKVKIIVGTHTMESVVRYRTLFSLAK